jgi:ankyrin repeat protein
MDALIDEEDVLALLELVKSGALLKISLSDYKMLLALAEGDDNLTKLLETGYKKFNTTTAYGAKSEATFVELVKMKDIKAIQHYLEKIKTYYTGSFYSYTSLTDAKGDNVLHIIAQTGDMDLWEILANYSYQPWLGGEYRIEHFFDFSQKNAKGLTPIEIAAKMGHVDLVNELESIYRRLSIFSEERLDQLVEKAYTKWARPKN